MIFCGLVIGNGPGHAQTADPGLDIPKIPRWDMVTSLRAAGGFKDNVLLSHDRRQSSPFLLGGGDLALSRLPLDGWQVNLLLLGEDTRYFQSPSVHHEDTAFAQGQIKRDFGQDWTAALSGEYTYLDRVLDASITEVDLRSVKVRGHTAAATPSVRRDFSGDFWLEVQVSATRQEFDQPLDGYWEGGPKILLGHNVGAQTELTLSFEPSRRFYDTREQATAAGLSIPRSHLEYELRRTQFAARHFLDQAQHWRAVTRLGFEEVRDNASGYFSFDKLFFSGQLRFKDRNWELKAQGKISHYFYPGQKASASSPELRRRTDFIATLRAERPLAGHWKLFAEDEFNRVLSNETVEAYRVNSAMAGLEIEF